MIVYNFLVLTFVTYCETKPDPGNNFPGRNKTLVKNVNFVEVIKQDLKRDNDDYKEMTPGAKNLVDVSSSKKSKIINKGYRRNAEDAYEEYDYRDTTATFRDTGYNFKSHTNSSRVVPVGKKQHFVLLNRTRSDTSNKIVIAKENLSFTPSIKNLETNKYQPVGVPKFVKINKIQSFQQFMKKNEGLFKNFVSNKIATQTQTTNVLRQMLTNKKKHKLLKPKHLGKGVKKIQRTEHNNGELPSADLLDMAPAKGGRIQKKREKDRLCHRHVLMPEGPKYDSRGRWYVPAHELVARRPYPATRRPRLLLPRCCNCCKKSLLGCE